MNLFMPIRPRRKIVAIFHSDVGRFVFMNMEDTIVETVERLPEFKRNIMIRRVQWSMEDQILRHIRNIAQAKVPHKVDRLMLDLGTRRPGTQSHDTTLCANITRLPLNIQERIVGQTYGSMVETALENVADLADKMMTTDNSSILNLATFEFFSNHLL